MAQTTATVDPQFIAALRHSITGIYFRDVSHFTPEYIQQEFRIAITQPTLVADEEVMGNLLFLIRKWEIRSLRGDVVTLVEQQRLKNRAQISALKTLFAIGTVDDRAKLDSRVAADIERNMVSSGVDDTLEWVNTAARIGGPMSLTALGQLESSATSQQAHLEATKPTDHAGIERCDKLRSGVNKERSVLSRKLRIEALPEAERDLQYLTSYVRRDGHLGYWGFKQMVDHPSPTAVDVVHRFVQSGAERLLPKGGISPERANSVANEYRIQALYLLLAMKVPLAPTEQQLLEAFETANRKAGRPISRPQYDWEDVLDRN